MGVKPSMSGLSWLAVPKQANAPVASVHSQPHPDPNCPPAAAWNFALKSSKEPKALSMAAARSPLGAEAPPGVMLSQKSVWL